MKDTSVGMKVAILIMLISFLYLFCVTFLPLSEAGNDHSKTIVGFFIGTVFGTLLNYYWGDSSDNDQGKPPER